MSVGMGDWKPGDQAECIDVSDIRLGRRGRYVAKGGIYLTLGATYGVGRVEIGPYGELCLELGGVEGGPKLACRFRRIRYGVLKSALRQRERENA